MAFDLMNQEIRKAIVEEVSNRYEKSRKAESLIQTEIYNGRIEQYVTEKLSSFNSLETVKEMPIVSSINLAERIVNELASVYKRPPTRTFTDLTDEQTEAVARIYQDMGIDKMLMKSNRSFKLQGQNHIQVLPMDGKLRLRCYRNHHITVIPNPINPEKAEIICIVSYGNEKGKLLRNWKYASQPHGGNNISNPYAQTTPDPSKQNEEMVVLVWSDKENFLMDQNGNVIGEVYENPIETLPFLDVSGEKDFEYWVRQKTGVSDFTISYNSMLSDVANIVRLQGYAQAYYKGSPDMIPESLQIGPNYVLKLPNDPNTDTDTEFGFANPGSDIGASQAFLEMVLANYLSSLGLDSGTITGTANAKQFSSGIERLLATIEQLEATMADFAIYEMAEKHIYKLVKLWHNTLRETDELDDVYKTALLPDESKIFVKYDPVEITQTRQEKLAFHKEMINSGLETKTDAIKELFEIGEEEAEEKLQQIREESIKLVI